MKITHDLLSDLLPVYLAGEASQDTRDLIEEFQQTDSQFAALVEAQRRELEQEKALLKGGQPALPPNHELQTLIRAKVALERRSWLMAIALMFTSFPCSFAFDGGHLTFLLVRDQPLLAGLCWFLAIAFWIRFLVERRRLKTTGL